jgi:hypothetical protein
MRCFGCGLGLVTELASVSVFAFSAYEIEAGLTTRQAGSDQFLLYPIGSTYALISAILVRKS